MKRLLLITAALVLAGCSKPAAPPQSQAASSAAPSGVAGFPAPSVDGLPAGDYALDPAHASLTFKVGHMGFSHYTARFAKFDAALKLDPAHPEVRA